MFIFLPRIPSFSSTFPVLFTGIISKNPTFSVLFGGCFTECEDIYCALNAMTHPSHILTSWKNTLKQLKSPRIGQREAFEIVTIHANSAL
jgi:hypothetical protein